MARSVELRTRAAIHGDGAWRSFMHVEGRSLKLHPEEDDLDEAVDPTTLSPKSMLRNVQLPKLRHSLSRIVLPTLDGASDGKNKVSQEAAYPGDSPDLATTEEAQVDESNGKKEEEEEDVNIEDEDISRGRDLTRFGLTMSHIDALYKEYRLRRTREVSVQTACCSKASICPSRSTHVRFLVGCARVHSTHCRCCLMVALHQNNFIDLEGALPKRSDADVCSDKCVNGCRRIAARLNGDHDATIESVVNEDNTEGPIVVTEPKGENKGPDAEGFATNKQEKVMDEHMVDEVLSKQNKENHLRPVVKEFVDQAGMVPTSAIRALLKFVMPTFGADHDQRHCDEGEDEAEIDTSEGVGMTQLPSDEYYEDGDKNKETKENAKSDIDIPNDETSDSYVAIVDASTTVEATGIAEAEPDEFLECPSTVTDDEIENEAVKIDNSSKPSQSKTLEELSIEVFSENPSASMGAMDVATAKKTKDAAERAAAKEAIEISNQGGRVVSGLRLDDNALGREGWVLLCRWLTTPPEYGGLASQHLQRLSLAHCGIGSRSTRLLVSSFTALPALASLNLACNPYLDVYWLARGLSDFSAVPKLASLDIAFCECPERDLTRLVIAFTRLECCPCSRELDMAQTLLPVHWSWANLALLSEALADWGWRHAEGTIIDRRGASREGVLQTYDLDALEAEVDAEAESIAADRVKRGHLHLGRSLKNQDSSESGDNINEVEDNNDDASSSTRSRGSLGSESQQQGLSSGYRVIENNKTNKGSRTGKKHRRGRVGFDKIARRVRMLPHRWLEIDDLRSTRVATLGGKDISDMEAYAISGSLGRNRHLRFLDLSDNRFGSVGAKAILKETHTLAPPGGLRVDLSGNALGRDVVGTWLWNACKIVEIRLSGTFVLPVQDLKGEPRMNLEALAGGTLSAIASNALEDNNTMLPPLEVLNLLGEDIGPLEQEALKHIIKFNHKCTELNGIVFDTEIESVDLSLAPLDPYEQVFVAKRLELNYAIRSLNLSGCAIDAEGSDIIARAVGSHKFLKIFRIDNNLLADDGAMAFGRHLRDNVSLTDLDISYNAISDTGISMLLIGLLRGPPPKQHAPLKAVAIASIASVINHKPNEKAGSGPTDNINPVVTDPGISETSTEVNPTPMRPTSQVGTPVDDSSLLIGDDGRNESEPSAPETTITRNTDDDSNNAKSPNILIDPDAVLSDIMPAPAEQRRPSKTVRIGETVAYIDNPKSMEDASDNEAWSDGEGEMTLLDGHDDDEETRKAKEEQLKQQKDRFKDARKESIYALRGPPPLTNLDLSGNFLSTLAFRALGRSPMGYSPQGTSRFSVLKCLSLRSISLTDATMTLLAEALYHSRGKKGKKRRRNYNSNDDEDNDGVAKEKSNVADNEYDEDEPEGPRFPFLKFLDLSGHHCCNSGLEALCKALHRIPSLRALRLGRSSVSAAEYEDDGDGAIRAAGVGITKIRYPQLKSSGRALQSIIGLLELHSGIEECDLTGLDLGDHWGGEKIAAILDSNASLKDLILEDNGLSGSSGEAIFRALGANMGLKKLSLARNPIGIGVGTGYGALHELSGLLQLNNTIEMLDISDCSLNGYESKGSNSISKALLRLIKVIEEKEYSSAFSNLRIAANPLVPKKALKLLRDACSPPFVIDFTERPKGGL